MTEKCFIPGCKSKPIARIKYRDAMGQVCTEQRCPSCSDKLQDSSKTDIIEVSFLDEDGNKISTQEQYSRLSEREKEYVRELTGGPLAPFAV